MIPFSVDFKPGIAFYEQLIHALKKAIISGVFQHGDKIPSIQTLSQELKINPNTVQKALTKLVTEKILKVQPGGYTIENVNIEQYQNLLMWDMEHLILEAKRLKLSEKDIISAVQKHWKELSREG
jgi:GntR family transcriptional regulator